MQSLLQFLQAATNLAGQRSHFVLAAQQQDLGRYRHQYTVQRTTAATLAQQFEQYGPGAAVDITVRLGQVAPGSVDQHGVLGKIPIAITGTRCVADWLALKLVEGELQARAVQQMGLAAGRRADQQIPRQIVAPAFAAAGIKARGPERG
ncbi:hypothetical protein D3C84_426730 [compost metagenome]